MALPTTAEGVAELLKKEGRRYIQFHFVNLRGELRGMEEAADLIPKIAAQGLSIDGSSVGVVDVNCSDIRLVADWTTYASYVADGEVIDRVLCCITYKGQKHPACIRTLMADTIARCNAMGYRPSMFGELEFYFLHLDGTPHDHAHYCSLPPLDKALRLRRQFGEALERAGCLVKRIHHENGPGQNEVELKLAPAMKNADDLVTSIAIIEAVAGAAGLRADFMPKPLPNDAGSGYHQHFALYDTATGKNVFAAEWPEGVRPKMLLSPLGQHFTAGLLAHADEITAVFARDDQSFVRLIPGHEAPGTACWGFSNRTALIRIPEPSEPQDTRIEYRGGDASGATYLLCAVTLAAGLDGIARKLECPPPVDDNADHFDDAEIFRRGLRRLPSTKEACKKILESSAWLREVLGETIVTWLIKH